ncbi:MAG: DNA-binding response regulator [Candidatus Nephthysia bennettiae]|nr:MAG: DNA-binding response regulator [Candidatus Dormibacteraeota bacterium]
MSIRVLLVDDQALLRSGMRMVLEEQPGLTVIGEAADGDHAIRLAAQLRPDVILMDVRMPGTDGIEATRRIVADTPTCRVLVLTTFDLDEYAYSALRYGASGFLLKDVPPADLVTAIRAVACGDAVLAPSVTRRLLDTYATHLPDPRDPSPSPHQAALETLTAREREVLIEIAAGLSNAEIAAKLYLAEATVKTHLGRILTKLDLRDRVQAIVFVYRTGIAHPDPPH